MNPRINAILATIMIGNNTNPSFQAFIIRDPQICGGQPIIKGTRVTIHTLLASLAEGDTVEAILTDFPTVSEKALWALIAFAATSAQEDLTLMPSSTTF